MATEVTPGSLYLRSGTMTVGQSGLNVVVQSGVNVVGSLSASISGQPVALVSGTQVGLSGLYVQGSLSTSVSGQPVSLVSGTQVELSGLQVIIQDLSGTAVVLESGTTITVASGQNVNIGSGVGVTVQSGLGVVINSGAQVQVTQVPSTVVRTRGVQLFSDLSGGQTLLSGGITSMSLRSLDGEVYVGGSTGIEYPYSGYGMLLFQGDSITLDVGNFNEVSVFSSVSGYRATYIGNQ